MKALLYDMANIYQQKAIDSLDANDLAHAKRYREAADALEAQAKEIAECDALREKLATLLAETAVALKGKEAALHRHSWHDLPVIALEKMITIEQLRALCDQMAGALEAMAGYGNLFRTSSNQVSPYHLAVESLTAWRAMK